MDKFDGPNASTWRTDIMSFGVIYGLHADLTLTNFKLTSSVCQNIFNGDCLLEPIESLARFPLQEL